MEPTSQIWRRRPDQATSSLQAMTRENPAEAATRRPLTSHATQVRTDEGSAAVARPRPFVVRRVVVTVAMRKHRAAMPLKQLGEQSPLEDRHHLNLRKNDVRSPAVAVRPPAWASSDDDEERDGEERAWQCRIWGFLPCR